MKKETPLCPPSPLPQFPYAAPKTCLLPPCLRLWTLLLLPWMEVEEGEGLGGAKSEDLEVGTWSDGGFIT